MSAPDDNPYVGPRPFRTGEAELFFGRDAELQHLVSLIVAHRVVLLFSPSGAGKSSLINAALLPEMERLGFLTTPPLRLVELAARAEDGGSEGAALGRRFERAIGAWVATADAKADDGDETPVLLVIDQFEELFALLPEERARHELLAELETALRAVPVARVVLSFREEFLAEVEFLLGALQVGRIGQFRLEPLRRQAAITAVQDPARRAGRPFAPGVPEELVRDLALVHVQAPGSTVEVAGEFVEPVYLQVTCQRLWDSTRDIDGPITGSALEHLGDVDEALRRHYEEAVAAAASAAGVQEREVRRGVERSLITPAGMRGMAFRGPSTTGELPNRVADELQARHVIRAEPTPRGTWYELVHDRILGPVRESNAAAEAQRQKTRRQWLAGVGIAAAAAVVAVAVVLAVQADDSTGSGGGVEGRISVSPSSSLKFDKTGAVGRSETVRLTAVGDRFRLTAITPSDNPNFTVRPTDGCKLGSLVSGCTLEVVFQPAKSGTFKATSTLAYRFEGDPVAIQRTVPLLIRGEGVRTRKIRPSKTYDFETVPVGDTARAILTLSGPYDKSQTITSVRADEETPIFAAFTPNCQASEGESDERCEIEVSFTPAAAETYTGRFAINYVVTDDPRGKTRTDNFLLVGTGIVLEGP